MIYVLKSLILTKFLITTHKLSVHIRFLTSLKITKYLKSLNMIQVTVMQSSEEQYYINIYTNFSIFMTIMSSIRLIKAIYVSIYSIHTLSNTCLYTLYIVLQDKLESGFKVLTQNCKLNCLLSAGQAKYLILLIYHSNYIFLHFIYHWSCYLIVKCDRNERLRIWKDYIILQDEAWLIISLNLWKLMVGHLRIKSAWV